MNNRKGFIAAGCWTLDRIKLISGWPEEEELRHILSTEKQGKKLDQAMPVTAIGLLGQDVEGDFLLNQAQAFSINTEQLRQTADANTAFTDVMTVAETGKRTFFHYAGCNDKISPEHFSFDQSSEKWLHLGLLGVHAVLDKAWQSNQDSDANGWVRVLKNAKSAGLNTNIEMVSIAADINRQICLPCLPYLDSLIVNDHEIGSIAGIETIRAGQTIPSACIAAAKHVLELGNNVGQLNWVVVHYPAGAFCVTASGEEHYLDAVPVDATSIQSTVGAGDAFAAGMLYALHEDWPIENALQLAHATAAASLRSTTTVGAVQCVDDVLALAGWQRPL